MVRAFAAHSYVKELPKAENHIRYIAFRSRESPDHERGLFGKDTENVDVKQFINGLHDKRLQHSSVAVIHKVLFSMSGDEWERSGFEPEDYKIMIRNVMEEFQLRTGKQIHWAAACHMNAGHPHIHLVMKASYTDKDGIEHRLKIDNEDKQLFKDAFQKEKNRIRGFELERPEREYERHKQKQRSITKSNMWLDALFSQIDKEMREREHERDGGMSR